MCGQKLKWGKPLFQKGKFLQEKAFCQFWAKGEAAGVKEPFKKGFCCGEIVCAEQGGEKIDRQKGGKPSERFP